MDFVNFLTSASHQAASTAQATDGEGVVHQEDFKSSDGGSTKRRKSEVLTSDVYSAASAQGVEQCRMRTLCETPCRAACGGSVDDRHVCDVHRTSKNVEQSLRHRTLLVSSHAIKTVMRFDNVRQAAKSGLFILMHQKCNCKSRPLECSTYGDVFVVAPDEVVFRTLLVEHGAWQVVDGVPVRWCPKRRTLASVKEPVPPYKSARTVGSPAPVGSAPVAAAGAVSGRAQSASSAFPSRLELPPEDPLPRRSRSQSNYRNSTKMKQAADSLYILARNCSTVPAVGAAGTQQHLEQQQQQHVRQQQQQQGRVKRSQRGGTGTEDPLAMLQQLMSQQMLASATAPEESKMGATPQENYTARHERYQVVAARSQSQPYQDIVALHRNEDGSDMWVDIHIHPSMRNKQAESNALAMRHLWKAGAHTNVVRVVEVLSVGNAVWCVQDYHPPGRDLFELVAKHGPLTPVVARNLFRQLIEGVEYLHTHRVCHLGLSLDACLLEDKEPAGSTSTSTSTGTQMVPLQPSERLHLKVGFLQHTELQPGPAQASTTPAGRAAELLQRRKPSAVCFLTPEILTPDLYTGQLFDPVQLDLWACGVILFTMVVGCPPFSAPCSADARYLEVAQGRMAPLLERWGRTLNPACLDLLQHMLTASPASRYTLEQIKQHPWWTANQ